MALAINTNLASLNALRNLTGNQKSVTVSLQRLSSGLRINSAKDDAAGMFASELMTSQIRGLNQSVRNASDGISLAQTAEGALAQITGNLQRIREIAVQSANATTGNRAGLQAEVDQLTQEISRIIQTTEFNGTLLLAGSNTLTLQVGADGNTDNQIQIITTDMTATTPSSEGAAAQAIVDSMVGQTDSQQAMWWASSTTVWTPGVQAPVTYSISATNEPNTYTSTDSVSAAAVATHEAIKAVYNSGGGMTGGVTINQLITAGQAVADGYAGTSNLNSYNNSLNATNTIDVSSQSAASAALSGIDSDISQMSTTRSTFGAVQNRFDAAIAHMQNYSENLAAARGRIMDADFATETALLTRSQILQQAGTAMLSQANTLPVLALSLLG